jgi:branched-chain amino acid transport system substrate-binding protein
MEDNRNPRLRRRTLLRAGLALPLAAPPLISARGETPVKIGFVDPLTGSLSALAVTEIEGAKYAVAQINAKGGILGRQVQLLVEDSANDVGTGVQKARKLIDRDKVDVLLGDVNSAIALALAQVTHEKKVLHIVPGGHSSAITGPDCHWNVFRVCNSTTMDTSAITSTLVKKFGKKFFFITPDYAYGHALQDGFVAQLKKLGGTYEGDMLPIASVDFSATLIKARAYKPNVLLNNMGGAAQVACMKQIVQFGMQKQMALAGALFELESVLSVPPEAQTGWWTMEWWWDQPGVPGVAEFVAGLKKTEVKAVTARHWMAYVGVHSIRLAAEKAKTLDGPKMAHALEGMELPPEIAMQKGKVFYRAGDHQLMSPVLVGQLHPPKKSPDDVFTIEESVPGETAAGPVGESGCKLDWTA